MAGRNTHTLAKWFVLLAAPLIWSAHLGFVYAVATLAITLTGNAGLVPRILIGAVTLCSLAAITWIGLSIRGGHMPRWQAPQADLAGLWRKSGALLCLLSFLGVLWQGLPALLIPEQPVSHNALFGGTAPPESRSN